MHPDDWTQPLRNKGLERILLLAGLSLLIVGTAIRLAYGPAEWPSFLWGIGVGMAAVSLVKIPLLALQQRLRPTLRRTDPRDDERKRLNVLRAWSYTGGGLVATLVILLMAFEALPEGVAIAAVGLLTLATVIYGVSLLVLEQLDARGIE